MYVKDSMLVVHLNRMTLSLFLILFFNVGNVTAQTEGQAAYDVVVLQNQADQKDSVEIGPESIIRVPAIINKRSFLMKGIVRQVEDSTIVMYHRKLGKQLVPMERLTRFEVQPKGRRRAMNILLWTSFNIAGISIVQAMIFGSLGAIIIGLMGLILAGVVALAGFIVFLLRWKKIDMKTWTYTIPTRYFMGKKKKK